jgi:hypothetical protein
MSFSKFQQSSRGFSPQETGFLVVVLIGVLVLLGMNFYLASVLPPSGEFSMLRDGGHAFLFENTDPYGAVIPAEVQEKVYGRPARAGEEPYILDIPFQILIFHFPFALGNEVLARGIYFFILEAALFFIAFLGQKLSGWQPGRLHLLLFFVVSIFNYYSINAFLTGTAAILLTLTYAGVIFLLDFGLDEPAGILMAAACFQWEIGGPFLLLILFYVLRCRRGRVLLGFGMAAFILFTISYLWYPGWTIPFMRASYNNWIAGYGFSMHTFLSQILHFQSAWIPWAVTGLLIVILGFEWSRVNEKDFRRFYWTICLTLAMTPFLGFRFEIEQLVVLILPLGLILQVISDRWSRLGSVVLIIYMLVYFVVPWLLFIQVAPLMGINGVRLFYLLLPVVTVISLYWIRWWTIRPPRTWLDGAGNE